ncbi:MAG TPA: extracellular solute-binding protein, partial [Spirochaetales bacterium]|nr:extracellular solute-binding protein [Spirochaetales bacterium]
MSSSWTGGSPLLILCIPGLISVYGGTLILLSVKKWIRPCVVYQIYFKEANMNKLAKYLLVALLLLGLTVSVFAGGGQEEKAEEKGKLVLATLNSVEGQTTKKALLAFAELKGIEVEIVEAPYSNLFEKQVLDMSQGTGLYDIVLLDDPWFT